MKGLGHLVVVALCSLLLSSGCSGDSAENGEPNKTTSFAGLTIQIAVPAEAEFPELWKQILDEWSAQTEAQFHVVTYDSTDRSRSLADIIRKAAGTSGDKFPALFVLPTTRLAELAEAGVVAKISKKQQSAANLNWRDLFGGLRDKSASLGNKPAVIPVSSPVLVCYYRRDLLEKARLSPPKTWDEYQSLLARIDQWAGSDMKAVEPWGRQYRATLFLSRAAAYAKHPFYSSFFFDVESGEPLIDNPGFVRALEQAREALALMPAEVKQYTPADCRREILSGRAAMAIAFESDPRDKATLFGPAEVGPTGGGPEGQPDSIRKTHSGPSNNPIRVDAPIAIGFVRLPGSSDIYNIEAGEWEHNRDDVNRATLTAFAGLCAGVSTGLNETEALAAWDLLATLTMDNLSEAFPGSTKSLCRDSQLHEAAGWIGPGLTNGEAQQYHRVVAKSLDDGRLIAEFPIIGRARFRKALSDELGTFLDSDDTSLRPHKVLQNTAARWRKIFNEVGADKVARSYRRSLGLPLRSAAK